LVTDSKAGTRRIYQLDPAGLQVLRAFLDRLWTRALTSFADVVNESDAESCDVASNATDQIDQKDHT